MEVLNEQILNEFTSLCVITFSLTSTNLLMTISSLSVCRNTKCQNYSLLTFLFAVRTTQASQVTPRGLTSSNLVRNSL